MDHRFRGKRVCTHAVSGSILGHIRPTEVTVAAVTDSCLAQVSQSGGGGSLLRYVVLIAARLSLLTMCGWVLCWTLVNLCKNHSVLNLLFLGYP